MISDKTEAKIIEAVAKCTKQPLPWEIMGDLEYDTEAEDSYQIYERVKEEISTTAFAENQQLDSSDYSLIAHALLVQREQFRDQFAKLQGGWAKAYHMDIIRLDKLIEKLEVVKANEDNG